MLERISGGTCESCADQDHRHRRAYRGQTRFPAEHVERTAEYVMDIPAAKSQQQIVLSRARPLTILFRTLERNWKFQLNQKCCVTRTRNPTAKTPTREVAVSKSGREETTSIERRSTLSLTNRAKQIKSVRVLKVYSSDRGSQSWHRANLVHTSVPIRKVTKITSVKIVRSGRLEEIFIAKKIGKSASLESLVSSTNATLPTCMRLRHQNGPTKSQLSSHAAHRPSVFEMHST